MNSIPEKLEVFELKSHGLVNRSSEGADRSVGSSRTAEGNRRSTRRPPISCKISGMVARKQLDRTDHAVPLGLTPTWTEPVDLAVLRESADPLGFRAAAERIAALMCSPVTGRTTSVRHLSMFCFAAWASTSSTTRRINRDAFDRAARIVTIATTGLLVHEGHALTTPQRRSLILPGRRRATQVSARLKARRARIDDFDLPILGSERNQGLWGGYASLANALGLLDASVTPSRLSPEGLRWAHRFRQMAGPASRPNWYVDSEQYWNEKAWLKLTESFQADRWPVTTGEVEDFRRLLDRSDLVARLRLDFLITRATMNVGPAASLAVISRNKTGRNLIGIDGTPLSGLAHFAVLAADLIAAVELPFRRRFSDGQAFPRPDLRPYEKLFIWARSQGLDMGGLEPELTSWDVLDRHHAALFHRRGRPAWPALFKQGLLELPGEPQSPDFRFGALRRIGQEIASVVDFA